MKMTLAIAALLLSTSFASASECKKNGSGYSCEVGGSNYNVANANSEAEANAAAVAYASAQQQQQQGQAQGQLQGQGQSQNSSNDNSNSSSVNNSNSYSSSYSDDSVDLATPAGGGCTWGVNVAAPGTGGFGLCGTTKNQTAAALAQIADSIGNPCAAENKVAMAVLLRAPLLKGITFECN